MPVNRKKENDRILRDKFIMEAMKILIPIFYEKLSSSPSSFMSKSIANECCNIADNIMKKREEDLSHD